jgi:hypothetical protein
MKSKFFSIVFSVLLLSLISCGGRSTNNQNTHTHEDGSVHENHATEQPAPKQESFKVETDNVTHKVDSVQHDHSHGEHGHEHGHKH